MPATWIKPYDDLWINQYLSKSKKDKIIEVRINNRKNWSGVKVGDKLNLHNPNKSFWLYYQIKRIYTSDICDMCQHNNYHRRKSTLDSTYKIEIAKKLTYHSMLNKRDLQRYGVIGLELEVIDSRHWVRHWVHISENYLLNEHQWFWCLLIMTMIAAYFNGSEQCIYGVPWRHIVPD